ncbi:hypothetical protein NL676_002400 [Syzygium grande]|nr:hypothetical protein NL676_002400 [Syzygium grande]
MAGAPGPGSSEAAAKTLGKGGGGVNAAWGPRRSTECGRGSGTKRDAGGREKARLAVCAYKRFAGSA